MSISFSLIFEEEQGELRADNVDQSFGVKTFVVKGKPTIKRKNQLIILLNKFHQKS